VRRHPKLAAVLAAAPLLLAGCGSSSHTGGNGTTTGGANADPAHQAMAAAGLTVCSEQQSIVPSTIGNQSLYVAARGFYVANGSCNGKTVTPDIVVFIQFASKENLNKGLASIHAKEPKAKTYTYKSVVVATKGPHAQQNIDGIAAHAQQAYGATTTTG
jgi:hypothetical protein